MMPPRRSQTFVIVFVAADALDAHKAQGLRGRARHVVSGDEQTFTTAEQLLQFIEMHLNVILSPVAASVLDDDA